MAQFIKLELIQGVPVLVNTEHIISVEVNPKEIGICQINLNIIGQNISYKVKAAFSDLEKTLIPAGQRLDRLI